MMHPPGHVVFDLEVKHDVVFAREGKYFIQCGDMLASELAVEPLACVKLAKLRESVIVHCTAAVCGPLESGVMDCHELQIARKMQVRLYESSSQFDRTLKGSERVLWRMAGRATVGNDPWGSHGVRYPNRFRSLSRSSVGAGYENANSIR
jgi:hypothetical protein